MPQYETIFVTEPTLPEEGIEELIQGYDQVTTAAGGKVLKVERWGKRRLAYPIHRHEDGIYVLMTLDCPAQHVKEIERRYRMNDRILRHLTVRVEDPTQLGPSPMVKPRPAEREEIAPEPPLAP